MGEKPHRQHLLVRLASERAGLLEALLGLNESMLTGRPVHDDWCVKDILAHIAAWDRWEERTMRAILAGEEPDFAAVQDFAAANTAFVAAQRDSGLGEVLAELLAARSAWVAWIEGIPDEEFYRHRSYYGHAWTFSEVPLQVQWGHDAEHATQIRTWRRTAQPAKGLGCIPVMLAALQTAREELLAAAMLVPTGERISRLVCGDWTLKDVFGHIADWEWYGAAGIRQMADGCPPDPEPIGSIESWNRAHALARRDQSWDVIWDDLFAARRTLSTALEGMNEDSAQLRYGFPWGGEGTPFQWLGIFVEHDREHAHGLREACLAEGKAS
jgi:hypothetical protein